MHTSRGDSRWNWPFS